MHSILIYYRQFTDRTKECNLKISISKKSIYNLLLYCGIKTLAPFMRNKIHIDLPPTVAIFLFFFAITIVLYIFVSKLTFKNIENMFILFLRV